MNRYHVEHFNKYRNPKDGKSLSRMRLALSGIDPIPMYKFTLRVLNAQDV